MCICREIECAGLSKRSRRIGFFQSFWFLWNGRSLHDTAPAVQRTDTCLLYIWCARFECFDKKKCPTVGKSEYITIRADAKYIRARTFLFRIFSHCFRTVYKEFIFPASKLNNVKYVPCAGAYDCSRWKITDRNVLCVWVKMSSIYKLTRVAVVLGPFFLGGGGGDQKPCRRCVHLKADNDSVIRVRLLNNDAPSRSDHVYGQRSTEWISAKTSPPDVSQRSRNRVLRHTRYNTDVLLQYHTIIVFHTLRRKYRVHQHHIV